MKLLAILQFLFIAWGIGVGITYFLRESKDPIERNIVRAGIGVSGFLVFMILIDFFHVPLDWKIPFGLAMIGPVALLITKKIRFSKMDWSPERIATLVVIALFTFNLWMHVSGAFGYPYLEDTDPLIHSLGVKYLSVEKGTQGAGDLSMLHYIDPYPPGYDILMSVIYQVSESMIWTLKFFNALIVAAGVLLFYLCIKRLSGDYMTALGATVIFTFIPCYLSHFIWAHSLVMTMFLVTFYAFLMIDTDRRWAFAAGIALASIFFSQPSKPLKMSVLLGILIIGKMVSSRSLKLNHWGAALIGGLIGLIWYGPRAYDIIFKGRVEEAREAGVSIGGESGVWGFIKNALPPDSGTATRVYSFDDLYFVTGQNMINNPVGLGGAIMILLFVSLAIICYALYRSIEDCKGWIRVTGMALAGMGGLFLAMLMIRYLFVLFGNPILTSLRIDLYAMLMVAALCWLVLATRPKISKEYGWLAIMLGWLVFTFLGINSLTFNLPIGLYAFRFWMLLAIPVSAIAGYGLSRIIKKGFSPFLLPAVIAVMGIILPSALWVRLLLGIGGAAAALLLIYTKNIPLARYLAGGAIIFAVILTAGVPKYQVNTSQWPPGPGFTSMGEIQTYNWLHTLPFDTKVYDFGSGLYTIARDKYQCYWCDYAMELEPRLLNATAEEIHEVLRREGYGYAMIGGNSLRMLRDYFVEDPNAEMNAFITKIDQSPLFIVAHQGEGAIIFRVV